MCGGVTPGMPFAARQGVHVGLSAGESCGVLWHERVAIHAIPVRMVVRLGVHSDSCGGRADKRCCALEKMQRGRAKLKTQAAAVEPGLIRARSDEKSVKERWETAATVVGQEQGEGLGPIQGKGREPRQQHWDKSGAQQWCTAMLLAPLRHR